MNARVTRTSFFAFAFALVLASASLTTHVVAAQPNPPAEARMGRFDLEGRLEALRVRLALDASQTQQVRAILEDAQRRMQALSSAPGAAADPMLRERRRRILWDVEDRIWAILSCPQKDVFRLYLREQLEERRDRAAHGGRGPHGGHGRGGPRR